MVTKWPLEIFIRIQLIVPSLVKNTIDLEDFSMVYFKATTKKFCFWSLHFRTSMIRWKRFTGSYLGNYKTVGCIYRRPSFLKIQSYTIGILFFSPEARIIFLFFHIYDMWHASFSPLSGFQTITMFFLRSMYHRNVCYLPQILNPENFHKIA